MRGSKVVTGPPDERLTPTLPSAERSCRSGSRLAGTTIDSPLKKVAGELRNRSSVNILWGFGFRGLSISSPDAIGIRNK
jgi:hypothetical protein